MADYEALVEDVTFLLADPRCSVVEMAERVGSSSPRALEKRLARAGARELANIIEQRTTAIWPKTHRKKAA